MRHSHAQGFALVVVIWVLGLILLLGTAITVGVRYRTRADSSLFDAQRAEAAAESAVNFAILRLLSRSGAEKTPFPLTCGMPGGEQTAISVTEEAGKVDLNAASARTVIKLFVGLTQDRNAGERIAATILAKRSPESAAGQSSPPNAQAQSTPPSQNKARAFQSVMELEAVDGMTPQLFRAALPLVTVQSGKAEPDPAAAPPILRDILELSRGASPPTGGATAASAAAPGAKANDEITIRADVSASITARFIREALVSLRPEKDRAFSIREWRRGDADEPFVRADTKDLQPCFLTLSSGPA